MRFGHDNSEKNEPAASTIDAIVMSNRSGISDSRSASDIMCSDSVVTCSIHVKCA
jgi:hypothetical protein